VTVLRRDIPIASKVLLIILTGIVCLALWNALVRHQSIADTAFVWGFCIFVAMLRLANDLPYRTSYDDDYLYVRAAGLYWLRRQYKPALVRFRDIIRVSAEFDGGAPTDRFFMPFNHILVEGAGGEALVIDPNYLKVGDVRDLIDRLSALCPGTVDETLLQFAQSDRPW